MAVHAVIPAAGLSRRMGRPKLTLDLGGQSVIARLLSVLDCDAIESTTIVHRCADSELRAVLQSILAGSVSSSSKVQIVTPEIDPPDMRASVEIALGSIRQRSQPRDDDAWLLVPADHPILEPDTLAELLAAWKTKQPSILIPTHAGQGGHPTFFRWSIACEVSKMPLDQGINWLLRDKSRVLRFQVDSDSVICDLDTPEDYERLLGRYENGSTKMGRAFKFQNWATTWPPSIKTLPRPILKFEHPTPDPTPDSGRAPSTLRDRIPNVKLSLSVRIAEAACKTKLNVPLAELLGLATEFGYRAICMRASAGGIGTPRIELERMRRQIEDAGLYVSMVTADSDVPINNDAGPNSLKNIGLSLDVAEALGADLIRVCLKTEADIEHARRAADQAAARGIRLAHQCHTTTLFEQVDRSLEVLGRIGSANFGLIYEPANLMLCGESYAVDTLKKFLPHLMNVYVQNHVLDEAGPVELETWCRGVRRFRHLPIWEPGGVDFDVVLSALQQVGYVGTFTVHQAFAEIMGPREAAVGSARYLQSFGCFE